MTAPIVAVGDLAGRDIQGREQRFGSVTPAGPAKIMDY